MLSTGKKIIQRIVQLVFVIFIRWIAVYQVNSAIQLSNNQNLKQLIMKGQLSTQSRVQQQFVSSTPRNGAYKPGWLGFSDIGRFLTCASSQSITSFQALLYSPRTSEQLRAMRSARAYKRNSTHGFHWIIDEKLYHNFLLGDCLKITSSFVLVQQTFLFFYDTSHQSNSVLYFIFLQ